MVDDEAAEAARRIFQLRAEGDPEHGGVPTKRDGKCAAATVRYVLDNDNPKYRGQVQYLFRWNGQEYVLRQGTQPLLL